MISQECRKQGIQESDSLPVLGIDPGHEGGALLLDATGTAAACWNWHELSRKSGPVMRLCEEIGGGQVEDLDLLDLHQVGLRICASVATLTGSKIRLTVEGLFGKGLTLERLSWYAALVSGPCMGLAEGGIYRPLASHWRPLILGIRPGVPADAAAVAALRLAPLRVPGFAKFSLRENEHTCEAGCIAVAGSVLDKKGEWPVAGAPPFTPEGGWKGGRKGARQGRLEQGRLVFERIGVPR